MRYSSEREDWIRAMVLARIGCCVMPEFLPTFLDLAGRAWRRCALTSMNST
ncbi:MAG: hypothetical protein ACR2PO_13305 [Methyloligellaceae bacterium]